MGIDGEPVGVSGTLFLLALCRLGSRGLDDQAETPTRLGNHVANGAVTDGWCRCGAARERCVEVMISGHRPIPASCRANQSIVISGFISDPMPGAAVEPAAAAAQEHSRRTRHHLVPRTRSSRTSCGKCDRELR